LLSKQREFGCDHNSYREL